MAFYYSSKKRTFIGSNKISKPDFKDTVKQNRNLGNLSLLPLEIRNNVYSRLLDEDYKQVYSFGTAGSIHHDRVRSSVEPPVLAVSATLREEALGAMAAGQYCTVRIDEHDITTNFSIHHESIGRTSQAAHRTFKIPACKRIVVTIDLPSPREGMRFYTLRQNIQAFVDIVNAGARDINPQICVELDRTGLHCTYSYNDFAMFFGPFVGLSSRCKAVMMFRTTGLPSFSPTVERYCNLIEAALSFVPEARRELMLHQYQIDIKLPISLIPFAKLNYNNLDDLNIPCWLIGPSQLSSRQLGIVAASAQAMVRLYEDQGTTAPAWLIELSQHLQQSRAPRQVSKSLQTVVLEGSSVLDMDLWAAGLISRYNPFFDDVKFFSGRGEGNTAE